MRLLYVTPTSAMGGAERVLLDILGLMRSAQPSWPIGLIVGNEGALADDARRLGVTTTVLPFPKDLAQLGDAALSTPSTWARFARHAAGGSFSTLRYMRRLRDAVADFKPDVMHSNGIKMHVLGALVKPVRSSLVWHFHDYASSRPVTSRLVRSLRSRCSAVVAVSDSVAADIRSELGESVDVRTIWNSVDLDRFKPTGSILDLAALSGLPPVPAGVPTIGLVATFARWKGHLAFLDALKKISLARRFRAYIVGGPLYETSGSQISMDELRAALVRLELADCVGLTGFVKDSPSALRSLDIVVHASTSPEPFGLVIAEAMAAGRTVVVSDSGGVAELVTSEVDALTYNSGDSAQMAFQIGRLLDDAALRRQLGSNAHAAALQQFDPKRACRQMIDLYTALTHAKAA